MPPTTPTNDTARRVGIWVVTLGILAVAIWGLIRLTSSGSSPAPASVSTVTETDHVKGTGQAVLIEYADFQCPACKTYYPILKRLAEEHPDKVKIVYRHYPIRSIHQNAELAAWASEAAARQGKFWEMHNKLFEGQESWSEERNAQGVFEAYAKDIGLNVEQFTREISDGETRARVNADLDSAAMARVSSTPTFFLNGNPLRVGATYDEFRNAVIGDDQ